MLNEEFTRPAEPTTTGYSNFIFLYVYFCLFNTILP